jgi:heptosyltransferase-1
VVGFDSGVSYLAVALGLPHVQIYNFDTGWRTGPKGCDWQQSVFATPTPSPEVVLSAFAACMASEAQQA